MKCVFFVLTTCVLSCSHTPDLRFRKTLNPLAEPDSRYSVDLESLSRQQITGFKALGLKAESDPGRLAGLRTYFKQRNVASVSPAGRAPVRVSASATLTALKKADYPTLENADLNQILRAAARMPKARLQQVAEEVSDNSRCQAPQLSLALAAMIENDFPEPGAVRTSTRLYEKAYRCDERAGEMRARAAYRLGLFAVAGGNCADSLPYWGAVSETQDVDFLFSRAEYWRNHCDTEEEAESRRQVAMEFYNSYPLSFHPLLEMRESNVNLGGVVLGRSTPRALVRTAHDANLNLLTEQIELAIENKRPDLAGEYLSWLTEEKLRGTEPHFQLYLGYLASLAHDGLSAFQILARTFSQYPQLKTATTLRFYYPKWYYDEIREEAKNQGLDPLMVLALVRQESAFNRAAISRVGARGLMQLMPGTARAVDRRLTRQALLDPQKNVRAGTIYLARLVKRYNGNMVLALAAYNAGFGNVDKWVARYKTDNQVLFQDLIPFRETREYVASILRNHYWYQVLENQGPRVLLGDARTPAGNFTDFSGTARLLRTGLATSDTANNSVLR